MKTAMVGCVLLLLVQFSPVRGQSELQGQTTNPEQHRLVGEQIRFATDAERKARLGKRGKVKYTMIEGTIVAVTVDSLFITPIDSDETRSLHTKDIRRLQKRSRTRGGHMAWGAGIGGLAGGVLGMYVATDVFNEGYNDYQGLGLLGGLVGGGLLGLLVGAVLPPSDGWKDVEPKKFMLSIETDHAGGLRLTLTKSF